jgi:hypothetical protein
MNNNITDNALNTLINARFVKNEDVYNKASHVFSCSVFLPSDIVIENKLKPYTYLTGFIQLVESFNVRIEKYLADYADKSALVVFYDREFDHEEYVFNNNAGLNKSKLNIQNNLSKKWSGNLIQKYSGNNTKRLFSANHYTDKNKLNVKRLFALFKEYIDMLKASDDPKYSRVVLVSYDINYKTPFNNVIHKTLHNNYNSIGMMARFLPCFDNTKEAAFSINGNFALSPTYFKQISIFLSSNEILMATSDIYAWSYHQTPDTHTYLTILKHMFKYSGRFHFESPPTTFLPRFYGGLFGLKNKIVNKFDGEKYVLSDVKDMFFIYDYHTDYKDITQNNANKSFQNMYTGTTDDHGNSYFVYNIKEYVNKFIDIIHSLRQVDEFVIKNMNIGTEYVTDELFLAYVFGPFKYTFVKSLPLNDARPGIYNFIPFFKNIYKKISDEELEKGIKILSIVRYKSGNWDNKTEYMLDITTDINKQNYGSVYRQLNRYTERPYDIKWFNPNFIKQLGELLPGTVITDSVVEDYVKCAYNIVKIYLEYLSNYFKLFNLYNLINYHDLYYELNPDIQRNISTEMILDSIYNNIPLGKSISDVSLIYKLPYNNTLFTMEYKFSNPKYGAFFKQLETDLLESYYFSRSLFINDTDQRKNIINNTNLVRNKKQAINTNVNSLKRNVNAMNIKNNNNKKTAKRNSINNSNIELSKVKNIFRTIVNLFTILSAFDTNRAVVLCDPSDAIVSKYFNGFEKHYEFFDIKSVALSDLLHYINTERIDYPY